MAERKVNYYWDLVNEKVDINMSRRKSFPSQQPTDSSIQCTIENEPVSILLVCKHICTFLSANLCCIANVHQFPRMYWLRTWKETQFYDQNRTENMKHRSNVNDKNETSLFHEDILCCMAARNLYKKYPLIIIFQTNRVQLCQKVFAFL